MYNYQSCSFKIIQVFGMICGVVVVNGAKPDWD